MRTSNFGLLAVLSCTAMVAATPIRNRAPAEGFPCVVPHIPFPPNCTLGDFGSDEGEDGNVARAEAINPVEIDERAIEKGARAEAIDHRRQLCLILVGGQCLDPHT